MDGKVSPIELFFGHMRPESGFKILVNTSSLMCQNKAISFNLKLINIYYFYV